jgi:hypothetical protein
MFLGSRVKSKKVRLGCRLEKKDETPQKRFVDFLLGPLFGGL